MKKPTAILIGLLALLCTGLICSAAAGGRAFISGAYPKENDAGLDIFCALPGMEGSEDSFSVALEGQELLDIQVSTVGGAGIPKTIYCLVDISGSMKGRMEQIKEILNSVSDGMRDGDNVILARIGNSVSESGFLSKDELPAEIETLVCTGEDTDLYSGISGAVRFFEQQAAQPDSEVNPVTAVLILSDGFDEAYGDTRDEAYQAVVNSNIPVYTAAVILSEKDYDAAEELGSFARNSCGGMALPKPSADGSGPTEMTGEETGRTILDAMDSIFYIQAGLTGIYVSGEEACMLSVTFSGSDGTVYTDGVELAADILNLPEQESDSKPDVSDSVPDSDNQNPDTLTIAGLAVAALIAAGVLVIAVVLILRLRRSAREDKERKRKEEEERLLEEERERLETEKHKRLEAEEQKRREDEEQKRLEAEEKKRLAQEAYNALPRLSIRLGAIGRKDIIRYIELVKGHEISVGRNDKAAVVLDARDQRLSSTHFAMYWDGGSVYLWDYHSTNGTALNGVPTSHLGRVVVKPGDTLRVGSYEYRLYWEG